MIACGIKPFKVTQCGSDAVVAVRDSTEEASVHVLTVTETGKPGDLNRVPCGDDLTEDREIDFQATARDVQ